MVLMWTVAGLRFHRCEFTNSLATYPTETSRVLSWMPAPPIVNVGARPDAGCFGVGVAQAKGSQGALARMPLAFPLGGKARLSHWWWHLLAARRIIPSQYQYLGLGIRAGSLVAGGVHACMPGVSLSLAKMSTLWPRYRLSSLQGLYGERFRNG